MSRDRQALEQELGAMLRTYQRAVDAMDEAAAEYMGVNRTDLRCLDVLLEQGQATPGYLADALGLTTGSVTVMLDRLEKLGYVERRPDPGDRRRVEVRPTPHAFTVAGRLYGPLAEEGARHLRRYTKPELELLIDVLQRTQALQETHTRRIREMLRDPDPDDQRGTPHGRRPPKGR